jgi:ABC-type glycerol-3-phosphate transport system substrate-binding protein
VAALYDFPDRRPEGRPTTARGRRRCAPAPRTASGSAGDGSPTGGSAANLRGLVMSAQSKQVEPTWEFMKFMLTKPVQDRVTPLVQEVPARLDSANETYANPEKAGPPAGRRLLKESIQATRALPAHYNAPLAEYRNQVSAIVTDVINGKVGVRDGMKQAEDAANAVFQRYGS